MKKIVSLLVMLCVGVFAVPESEAHPPLPSEKKHELAKKLYGRIKVVQSFHEAEYSVYVSDSSDWTADLFVFVAEDVFMANKPGYWYFVNDNYCDFTIRFVNSETAADISIAFTHSHARVGPKNR